MARRDWSGRVLKGEELYYYTLKLNERLKAIQDKAAEDIAEAKEELQSNIDSLSDVVDTNKQEADAAIDELSDRVDELENNSVQLQIAAAAEYDDNNSLVHIYEDAEKQVEIIPKEGSLYLVPAEEAGIPQNSYNEYIWNNEQFELVGSTSSEIDKLEIADVNDIWNQIFPNY